MSNPYAFASNLLDITNELSSEISDLWDAAEQPSGDSFILNEKSPAAINIPTHPLSHRFFFDSRDNSLRYKNSFGQLKDAVVMRETKTLSIDNPSSSESKTILQATYRACLKKVRAVLVGSSSPSVLWHLKKGPDRSASGNDILADGFHSYSVNSGDYWDEFSTGIIEIGEFLWFETSDTTGTVDEFHATFYLQEIK